MDEGRDRVKATYGDNYGRLARVKSVYDREYVLRVNQNIEPAGGGGRAPALGRGQVG
jgi:berberine-like enzyme